jgi:hypothetical protein
MPDTKTIEDLRSVLFETLQAVKAGTLELDRARAINELGRSITETAKVEVEYLRATGGGESAFLSSATGNDNLPPGITGVTTHRLR